MIKYKKRLAPGVGHKFKNRPLLWDEKISQSKDEGGPATKVKLIMKK